MTEPDDIFARLDHLETDVDAARTRMRLVTVLFLLSMAAVGYLLVSHFGEAARFKAQVDSELNRRSAVRDARQDEINARAERNREATCIVLRRVTTEQPQYPRLLTRSDRAALGRAYRLDRCAQPVLPTTTPTSTPAVVATPTGSRGVEVTPTPSTPRSTPSTQPHKQPAPHKGKPRKQPSPSPTPTPTPTCLILHLVCR